MERDAFREAVFARDGGHCVVPWCDHYAEDAHHLIERALWKDGGYHVDNGVSVCNGHHKEAEANVLSPQELRTWAGITTTLLPEGLSPDVEHDKWGKIKYPRTSHLPWSPGATNDDKVLKDTNSFLGKEVVITEKMDGENTTLYRNGYHARALDTEYHPTRTWVKNLQAKISWEIPEGWRICGENMAGTHSIKYDRLPSFFLVFSIWNEDNWCLSWDDTVTYADMLGLETVPVLHRFRWDRVQDSLHEQFVPSFSEEIEGYVMRWANGFSYEKFGEACAKYVRKDHITSNRHWRRRSQVEMNELGS